MNLKKLVAGMLILGTGIISSTQLLATDTQSKRTTKVGVTTSNKKVEEKELTETEKMYKEKCIEILKEYCGLDLSAVAQEVELDLKVMDVASDLKRYEETLPADKQAYQIKKITKEQYEQGVRAYEKRKKQTYDRIVCIIGYDKAGKTGKAHCACEFNGDTKGLLSLGGPMSDEGKKMSQQNKESKLSMDEVKKTYSKLVKDNKIAGIETPVCTKAERGTLPTLTFQDKKDLTKTVCIELDPATGKVLNLTVL